VRFVAQPTQLNAALNSKELSASQWRRPCEMAVAGRITLITIALAGGSVVAAGQSGHPEEHGIPVTPAENEPSASSRRASIGR
jgi:hypothetical protein